MVDLTDLNNIDLREPAGKLPKDEAEKMRKTLEGLGAKIEVD